MEGETSTSKDMSTMAAAKREPLVASKLDKETLFRHLRISEVYNAEELPYIQALQSAAINYICDQCGVTPDYVDAHEDLAIATLVLIADMYDQREMLVDSTHVNRTVETILGHHDRNFIGEEIGYASW